MRVEELEAKLTPSFVTYQPGVLRWQDGHTDPALAGFPTAGGLDTNDREAAVSAGLGGGPVVQTFAKQGGIIASFYAFPADFRGGVGVAMDDGVVRVAPLPGSGGGPIVRTFSLVGELLSEEWVGDPNDRNGVLLGGGNAPTYAAPAPTQTDPSGVPLDLSSRGVRFIAGDTPTSEQWERLRQSMSHFPKAFYDALIAAGKSIDVVNGVSITNRPGLPPGTQGLYGPIDDLAGVGDPIVVRLDEVPNGSVDVFIHELAHGLDAIFPGGKLSNTYGWDIYSHEVPWTTQYERDHPAEALAESIARFEVGAPQPDVRINPYLANVLSNRGWL